MGFVNAVTPFTVTEPLVAPATPAPTPPLPVGPKVGLEPLLSNNNLGRIWHFDNDTEIWTFFDPRPTFALANSIFQLVTGHIYLIKLISGERVTLNGKERSLSTGWNLISW